MWKTEGEDFAKIREPSMIFSIDLAYLKNSTFFEEKEIRIVRLILKNGEGVIDVGGNSNIGKVTPLGVLIRIRNGTEIRYVKIPININDKNIIKEIIIGPKNDKTIEQVQMQLANFGLADIKVKKSKSSYC